MSPHLAAKRLSAYLDDELAERDLHRVERHIAECGACRNRLHGLRLVVSELQRMPAASPPPSLARRVETQAAMGWGTSLPGSRRLLGRRGLGLLRDMIQLSAVSAGAVATIAFLIAYGAGSGPGGARRSARPAPSPAIGIQSTAPVSGEAELERTAAGGRVFVWREGVWWQRDLLATTATTTQPPAPLAADRALARAPWLAPLLRRGPVVVEIDGAPATVDFAPAGRRASSQRSTAAE